MQCLNISSVPIQRDTKRKTLAEALPITRSESPVYLTVTTIGRGSGCNERRLSLLRGALQCHVYTVVAGIRIVQFHFYFQLMMVYGKRLLGGSELLVDLRGDSQSRTSHQASLQESNRLTASSLEGLTPQSGAGLAFLY